MRKLTYSGSFMTDVKIAKELCLASDLVSFGEYYGENGRVVIFRGERYYLRRKTADRIMKVREQRNLPVAYVL